MAATFLPAPRHKYEVHADEGLSSLLPPAPKHKVPPYGQRQSFVPRAQADFGDGGAFPEIHVAQFPLEMGRPATKKAGAAAGGGGGVGGTSGLGDNSGSTAIVAVDVDENGKVKHDAIVKQGTNRDKIVYSQLSNIKEKRGDVEKLQAPTADEEALTAERTRQAFEKLIGAKVTSATPGSIGDQTRKEAEFIKYTPNPNAPGYNNNAKQRVVRMVAAQVDPMEPPKHKHKKVPRAPADDPVPVLHSPPRKVTVQDQQAWKIPPCVSNWKNARGYTIPLDKRLAADGSRGLQENTVSPNFATLSESLYIAERKAREETRLRGEMLKQVAMREKDQKEADLRDLASRARLERAGIARGGAQDDDSDDDEGAPRPSGAGDARYGGGGGRGGGGGGGGGGGAMGDEERVAAEQRERLRAERKKDRERDLRIDNMRGGMKKQKLDKEKDRDISEKIALGMHKGGGGKGGADLYDARLFNQSAGMDSGFGAEDGYGVYSKPMFNRGEAQSVYKPKTDDGDAWGDADQQMSQLTGTERFRADRGFKGTESGATGARNAPVQFEADPAEADPFGLDAFLKDAKSSKKK
ncbi:unnamed protein product [Ectocarpus sp. 6 AP-2014]